MSVNANTLRRMRDKVERDIKNDKGEYSFNANTLIALNMFITIAEGEPMTLSEISTLTDAGRIIVEKYGKENRGV